MNLKRTATIVVVGAALVAWLAGAATSNQHDSAPQPFVQRRRSRMRGAELAVEIARLHERLRPTRRAAPAGTQSVRVPRRGRAVAPAPAPSGASAALAERRAAPIALPALKLAGIAEDAGADGPVRIAIISGEGQLFMVKEGETVTPRYRVAKISADVVELIDLIDNTVRRLALR